MKFVNDVASRYLFSSKGTHFINIISGVTILGLTMGTAALILVLSVFNGFEELIASMINQFNPELKIIPATGKYFDENDALIAKIKTIDGVAEVSKTIEETVAFEYQNINNAGTLKGVDDAFRKVTSIDSTIIDGSYELHDDQFDYAVLGSGMARNLSVDVLNVFESLSVHMIDRKAAVTSLDPFRTRLIKPIGVFSVQQDIDNEMVIVPLDFAQSLLARQGQLSSLGIRLSDDADPDLVQTHLAAILDHGLLVKNRYQQDEEFLKLMNIEKWMAFLIACLMILLIAFNLIGCLWMIILDKKNDIAILRAMGSTGMMIRQIFMRLGLLFTSTGLIMGILLAVFLYVLQKQFGIITIPQGFVVDTYPIKMKGFDILIVALSVFLIGSLASLPAAIRASKLSETVRDT
ncbi:MAG: ABC transporter permease [Saprospiraceae bacterium]|nr:ABC transporter permease [Saprospiraceae bacterium]